MAFKTCAGLVLCLRVWNTYFTSFLFILVGTQWKLKKFWIPTIFFLLHTVFPRIQSDEVTFFSNSFCSIWKRERRLGSRDNPGSARVVVVYQYTRKKFAKIPQNTQNSSKYTQNYTQVYFIPEIQRKWYTEYPYLSCNIPYTRFKKPLYTVYPKTLADPDNRSICKANTTNATEQDWTNLVLVWNRCSSIDFIRHFIHEKGNHIYL